MVLFFLGVGVTLIGIVSPMYYPAIKPYETYILVLGIILIVFPIFFKLFKWRNARKIIFSDNFSSDKGWQQYGKGFVSIQQGISKSLGKALKKDKNNDPNGGYICIEKKFTNGFCFSGWVYSPSQRGKDAWGDRIAIEGDSFNGYGFAIAQALGWAEIERRDGGNSTIQISERVKFSPPKESWYRFEFSRFKSGEMTLYVYDSFGGKLVEVFANDKSYNSFDRITVHGGYPYYIDDLQIKIT